MSIEMYIAIASLLAGSGILTGAAWWVVSGVFGLRNKQTELEGRISLTEAEVRRIHHTCHGRELWLKQNTELLHRIDKRQAAMASRMGVSEE